MIKPIIPFLIFSALIIILWRALSLHATEIPSPLINEKVPEFQLPTLLGPKPSLSSRDFLGHVTLLNVFATWCNACVSEHPYLLKLAKENHVVFYGLDYKDDTESAKTWLSQSGNPYQLIGIDESGDTAINWGVYGTPETFVIDKLGIIRYKQIGAITPDIWETLLKPLVEELQRE